MQTVVGLLIALILIALAYFIVWGEPSPDGHDGQIIEWRREP